MFVQQLILHSTKSSFRPLTRKANFSTTTIKMTGLTGMFSNRYKFDDIPDQRNKVAIVTGGSAGIGSSIAMGLAIAGADVHIVSTTPEHGEETASQINSEVQKYSTASPKFASGHCTYHQLDLGDLNAVKAFGEKMLEELKITTEEKGVPEKGLGNPGREKGSKRGGLNYLINNAGIGVAKFDLTKDGLANHFAVNHLAHMLLINTLLPLLEETRSLPGNKTGDVRIVNMASEQHRLLTKDVEFKTLEEVMTDVGGNNNYARSKLMNILYTKELVRRVLSPKGNQILAIATHPGVVSTGQQRAAEEPYGILGTALTAVARIAFMSPDQGAESSLWAATASKVAENPEKYQGAYLRQPDDDLGSETDTAKDPKLAANLWEMSTKVIKDKTGVVISA